MAKKLKAAIKAIIDAKKQAQLIDAIEAGKTVPNIYRNPITGTVFFKIGENVFNSKKIGSGGFGAVYGIKSIDPFLATEGGPEDFGEMQTLALKTGRTTQLERMIHEQDDGIILETNNNEFVISMPWHEQGDLLNFAQNPLSGFGLLETYRYLTDMTRSVIEFNRKGFIHRDIKPVNFLVAQNGQLFLGDFGLALQANQNGQASDGMASGTMGYIHPLAQRDKIYNEQTEGYALFQSFEDVLRLANDKSGSIKNSTLLKSYKDTRSIEQQVTPTILLKILQKSILTDLQSSDNAFLLADYVKLKNSDQNFSEAEIEDILIEKVALIAGLPATDANLQQAFEKGFALCKKPNLNHLLNLIDTYSFSDLDIYKLTQSIKTNNPEHLLDDFDKEFNQLQSFILKNSETIDPEDKEEILQYLQEKRKKILTRVCEHILEECITLPAEDFIISFKSLQQQTTLSNHQQYEKTIEIFGIEDPISKKMLKEKIDKEHVLIHEKMSVKTRNIIERACAYMLDFPVVTSLPNPNISYSTKVKNKLCSIFKQIEESILDEKDYLKSINPEKIIAQKLSETLLEQHPEIKTLNTSKLFKTARERASNISLYAKKSNDTTQYGQIEDLVLFVNLFEANNPNAFADFYEELKNPSFSAEKLIESFAKGWRNLKKPSIMPNIIYSLQRKITNNLHLELKQKFEDAIYQKPIKKPITISYDTKTQPSKPINPKQTP